MKKTPVGAVIALSLAMLSCSRDGAPPAQGSAAELAFRDAAVPPPPDYRGPRFKLSRDFPREVPAQCAECTWLDPALKVNFQSTLPAKPMPPDAWQKGNWAEYIKRIMDYVRQGQDPNLADAVGFQVNVNGKTRWFNVPWMAVDPTAGREYIHGTTNERTAHLSDLIGPGARPNLGAHTLPGISKSCQEKYPHGFESWSVGYYNEWGGLALGKAIPPSGRPATVSYQGVPVPDGLPFPEGTAVVKVLTTTAPEECVPFLKGAPKWTVDRHKYDPEKGYLCEREPQVNHVVQIDVAVVDQRSPTRWVYGTFVYDGSQPGATFWDRMVPLGLQWGSDPWTFPAVPRAESQPIQQTVLNPGVSVFEHYGCEKRLAGPVDNPASSCLSCHGSGYAAKDGQLSVMGANTPPSFGFTGICSQYSLDNAAYFQNVSFPQSFPNGRFPDTLSMDTSLQLQVAYAQYGLFNTGARQACTDPNQF
jgi:hypothetical protein